MLFVDANRENYGVEPICRMLPSSPRGEPQIWGVSEAMSAIRVPRTRRENTVQQRDVTLPGGDLDPGPGRTWTRTC